VFSSRGRNFLRTILKIAAERDELRIVEDQIGSPTSARFIADATAALIWKSTVDRTLAARVQKGETVNVCSAGTTSWFGFAQYVVAQAPLARRPRVTPIPSAAYPTKARRPHNSALSLARLRDVWGIESPPWQVAVDLSLRELGSTGP
jgi:dTDP-4-dehydrorhamnose reductase